MIATLLIFCCIATLTRGVPLQEDTYSWSGPVSYDDSIFKSVPNPQERAEKEGYTAETHEVVTTDGHIIQIFRITGSPKSPKAPNKPPVLLLHGLMDCAVTWVLAAPNKGLGYILADQGYDVWLGNTRGNRYARKHKWLTTKDTKFWLFSWHEIGMYDIPAMIDYILDRSEHKKLMYLGHSQGTTSFFVMASERPEYQEKVEAMFALAPPAYMKRMSSPLLRLLVPFANDIRKMADLIGMYEFMPSPKIIQQVGQLVCGNGAVTQPICAGGIFLFIGPGERLFNMSLLEEIVKYDPAGASVRQVVHYTQLIQSGKFQQYDHGLIKNLQKYGKTRPPEYALQNIKIPVYLHYSENDVFVNVKDLYLLHEALPNSHKILVPEPSFTHIDFIWSNPVDTLLYNRVMSLMTRYHP